MIICLNICAFDKEELTYFCENGKYIELFVQPNILQSTATNASLLKWFYFETFTDISCWGARMQYKVLLGSGRRFHAMSENMQQSLI